MPTRNETTEIKQQGQQNAQQNTAARSGTEVTGGARAERERGLRTSRESSPQTGMVRSDWPGSGLTDLSPGRGPFSLMRRMMEDMDRVFEDFGLGRSFGFGRSLSPFYRSERSYGRFFRSIPLPEGTEADKADATCKDGVLEVTLPTPKREQRRGRKIQIR